MFVYSRIKCSFALVGRLACSIRSRSSLAEMKGNSAATTKPTPKIWSQVVLCFGRKVATKAVKPSITHSKLRPVSKRTLYKRSTLHPRNIPAFSDASILTVFTSLLRGASGGLLHLKGYWKILAVLSLALANGRPSSAESQLPSANYYWQASPAGDSAQLLTLFCRACEDSTGSGRDIPLVAVLRDTLGDSGIENDRVSYVWLLTYSRPTWEKRALSAVPFFYWKVGDRSSKVRSSDLKPLMNLNLPQHSVVSSSLRNVVQWTVLDPLTVSVRASSRAYQNNQLDHERLHLEEAESYLQSAPVTDADTGLNQKELDTVIARLELRKTMLGDFVSGHRAAEFGRNTNLADERTRARNWELLRQCADKTGLFFEPINLAGTRDEYAVLWYATDRLAPPDGPRLGPIWKLLNLRDPYTQRDHLLKNTLYRRTWNGETREVVPLGVYSLAYPKMPLLMVDFYDGGHLRRHELTQRAITEITSGVIGLSRFGNWYYFVGADLYDFYASRRGTAMNKTERLSCYSKFRVALALDSSVDPPCALPCNSAWVPIPSIP